MHADWFDARQNVVPKKARWTDEEALLLANKEAKLTRQGTRFMNQALFECFPDRTLESIKAKRKQPAYKEAVKKYLSETEDIPAVVDAGTPQEAPALIDVNYRQRIADFLLALPMPTGDGFLLPRLARICNSLSTNEPATVVEELTLYLRSVFPVKPRGTKIAKRVDTVPLSRHQVRKAEYARTQDLWRKNRCKCLRMLLDDISGLQIPPKEVMVPFWETVMTNNVTTSPGTETPNPPIESLWEPITEMEIKGALPASTTSAGPDGLAARFLRRVPTEVLLRIFNIVMWCEKAPTYLLESCTTLIPKKSNAHEPSEFRPITVSSVLLRTLHKVLATRMARRVQLDQRQRAFRPTDGCSDNIFLLDLILRYHHKHHKPLFVASLDIAKAFDSVSHGTIEETLTVMGIPPPMQSYIIDGYQRGTTALCCNSWTSTSIHPACGVKQGDPMSPIIFNMVIDRLLRRLPQDIGVRIGDSLINAAAFADDMLLFASTPLGLQTLLNKATKFLAGCGLHVNASKCMTISLRNVPHEKKTVVDRDTVFLCGNRVLPALKRTDEWSYLGIPFTPEGRVRLDLTKRLQTALQKLTAAPLKPQQRLFGLKIMVLPGIFHQAELGNINVSVFRKCDRLIRSCVRNWLNLPTDTPNAYIHAHVKNGGLGVPALRWSAPLKRLQRLRRLPMADAMTRSSPGAFLRNEIEKCSERLREVGQQDITCSVLRNWWAQQLHAKVDGGGLKESAKVPQQHVWLQDGTRFLSGKDFLQACKLRINALPTRSRTARGRPKTRHCRAGCNNAETLNHVLQQCHRTHSGRIKRHDALASYVCRSLQTQGYEVFVEPKIKSSLGLRKPDIVAKMGVTALVIDAQVVGDQTNLDEAHNKKVEYYGQVGEEIRAQFEVGTVIFSSITLSWRGIWSKASAEHLTATGVIKKNQIKVLSTRAIVGGLACFHLFNKSTQTVGRAC